MGLLYTVKYCRS